MGHLLLWCSALLCLFGLSRGRFVMQRDFFPLVGTKGLAENCGRYRLVPVLIGKHSCLLSILFHLDYYVSVF